MKINFCAGLKLLVGVALAISTATVFCQNVYNNEQVKTLAKQVGEEKATSCLLASRYMQKEYSSSKPSPPDPNGLDYGPIPKYPLKLGMVAQTLHATFERLATQFISVKKSTWFVCWYYVYVFHNLLFYFFSSEDYPLLPYLFF